MQTARMTVLMTPDRKAAIEQRAAQMGVSSGEFIRLAVDNYDRDDVTEEELGALVDEVNQIIPQMQASLQRSSEALESTHQVVDQLLKEMGIRQ